MRRRRVIRPDDEVEVLAQTVPRRETGLLRERTVVDVLELEVWALHDFEQIVTHVSVRKLLRVVNRADLNVEHVQLVDQIRNVGAPLAVGEKRGVLDLAHDVELLVCVARDVDLDGFE